MAYATPTIDQFKAQLYRDFPYSVPSFGARGVAVVSGGAVASVTLSAGGQLYQKSPLVVFSGGGGSGATADATVTNNAVSGFTVTAGGSGYTSAPSVTIVSQDGDDTDITKVTNQDILYAQGMTPANINMALFPNQGTYQTAFNLLSAHYLVTNLLASSQGVKSQYDWLTQQRTVGNVNASFAIPERIKKSPFFSTLTSTRYGAQYLSLIAPLLHGNMVIACGATTP